MRSCSPLVHRATTPKTAESGSVKPNRALLVLTTALVSPSSAAEPQLRLPIAVYNYAGVPERTLAATKQTVERILDQAGIEPEWVTSGAAQPGTTLIKLLTPEMGERLGVRPTDMGLAAVDPQTGFGCEAYILTGRVEREAAAQDIDFAFLLGLSIVHELGHLFLGAGHQPFGIMKARLLRADLSRAARGEIGFDASQRRRIHSRLKTATSRPIRTEEGNDTR